MTRPSFYVILLAAALLATAFSGKKSPVYADQASSPAITQTNAAFRDGVYVGQFHRKDGMLKKAPWAWWNNDADRHAFIEGYELGYAGASK